MKAPSVPPTQPHTYVLTAAADYLPAALDEVRRLDPSLHQIMEPSQELAVVESALSLGEMHEALSRDEPLFLRHIVPAQSRVILAGDGDDLGTLARAVLEMEALAALAPDETFSVQARVIPLPGHERPYSPYAIKSAIVPQVEAATDAHEDVRAPQIVISVLALSNIGFLGISPVSFNRSDWAGGARRFRVEEDQLSRAEFKLLEALELFGAQPPAQGWALDLGAAPGGWTRVLRERGLRVTAVDPAELEASLTEDPDVESVRTQAHQWLPSALGAGRKYDVIVNDMRMDARDAARLMVEAAPLLTAEGFALMTLKLPDPSALGMDSAAIAREALAELRSRYRTVRARQLFHNRNEVTVFLKR